MSVETVIKKIARRGLLVNNLFQLSENRWQANLRTTGTKSVTIEWGRGSTPEAALVRALKKSKP